MDDLQIRVVDKMHLRERQRRRETLRLFIRTLVYLTSVIPAAIIAWKFELTPFRSEQPPAAAAATAEHLRIEPPIVVMPRREPQRDERSIELREEAPIVQIDVPDEPVNEPPAARSDPEAAKQLPVTALHTPSAIVTLTLEDPVIRVITQRLGERVGTVWCDVGLSRNLAS